MCWYFGPQTTVFAVYGRGRGSEGQRPTQAPLAALHISGPWSILRLPYTELKLPGSFRNVVHPVPAAVRMSDEGGAIREAPNRVEWRRGSMSELLNIAVRDRDGILWYTLSSSQYELLLAICYEPTLLVE